MQRLGISPSMLLWVVDRESGLNLFQGWESGKRKVAKSKHTKVDVFRTLERESLGCVIEEANYAASKNQREGHCLWCFEVLKADKEGLL